MNSLFNYNFFNRLQKEFIDITIILGFCLIQISLNYLSIFFIAEPYLFAILIFLLIQKNANPPSKITFILSGLLYDFITGTLIGMHSLFFILLINFYYFFENKYELSKKYGDWILFSLIYTSTLLFTKLAFIIVNFKIPDIYPISFNLGCTLLIFPLIKFLVNLPKIILKILNI